MELALRYNQDTENQYTCLKNAWLEFQIDGEWIDREGVSILTYAACMNNIEALHCILKEIKGNSELMDSQIPKSDLFTSESRDRVQH